MKKVVIQKALAVVKPAVSGRSTLPVLANVAFDSSEDGTRVMATNLEHIVCVKINEVLPKTTVHFDTFNSWLNSVSGYEVDINLATRLNTKCGRAKGSFAVIDFDEFPLVPDADSYQDVAIIDRDELSKALKRTAYSAASDMTRPALNGINFVADGERIKMESTDGFRLARVHCKAEMKDNQFQAIIPLSTIRHLMSILDSSDGYQVELSRSAHNNCLFRIGDIELYTNVVQGRFPDTEPVWTDNKFDGTVIHMPLALLKDAVKSCVSVASELRQMSLLIAPDGIEASLSDTIGSSDIHIPSRKGSDDNLSATAVVEGAGIEIGINTKYLLDFCNNYSCANVEIGLSDSRSPMLIKPADDDTAAQIIMLMTNGGR